MADQSRRQVLKSSAGAIAAGIVSGSAVAQTANSGNTGGTAAFSPSAQAVRENAPPITQLIADFASTTSTSKIPESTRTEVTRTLLNWIGCAVGGSHSEATTRAVKALKPFSGPAQASILGRTERFDILNAALINGISSHVLDYDDTHLKTIIHPAGPVASAILAYAEYHPISGQDFMNALTIGCEIECRIGNSVYPEHYAKGWHITGTTGMFGAAAAVGKLLKLNPEQMRNALGIAASQPVGLKVQFGSDTKSFHPGKAAQNGMMSALLASQGFTASKVAIEGFDGWGQAASTRHDWNEITRDLGEKYEIALNTYKPFACGIVAHPAIDAAIQLRQTHTIATDQIKSIELRVHPLVLNLMGKTEPKDGLESKFSIYHAVAVALVTGRGGEQAFSDKSARDSKVTMVRNKVHATTDAQIKADQADMTVTLNDGSQLHQFIEHAVGSQLHPMSNAQLEDKFRGLSEGILSNSKVNRLINLCWKAWDLNDVGEIARAATGR